MTEYEKQLEAMSESAVRTELLHVLRLVSRRVEVGANCDRVRLCRREIKRREIEAVA